MTTLRRTVDFATLIAAVALLGGLGAYHFKGERDVKEVDELAADVREFQQMVHLRSATKDVVLNGRGWPVTIDPMWFKGDPPRNPLLTSDRNWVEIAPPEHAHLTDPQVRIALDKRYASFWYNPYQGLIRARVPMQMCDAETLQLYNIVNGTTLSYIHRTMSERDPAAPAALTLPNPEAPAPLVVETPPAPAPAPPPPPPAPDENSPDALDPTKAPEPAPQPPPALEPIVVPSSPAFPTAPPPKPKAKPRGRTGG